MEEKNNKKIGALIILLIIAIIAMIAMGIFIYKLNNDKKAEIQKNAELQAEVDSLNETLTDLQGKIDTISETINPSNTSSKDGAELSEDFIKTQFKNAWTIFKKSYDIFEYDNNDTIDIPVEGQSYTWKYYKITNYDEIVDKYISSSFSNLVDSMELVISDNNNYYLMDSAEGTPLDKIDEVKNINQSNNKVSCIVKVDTQEYEFELINENGSWKISKFNLSK